MATTTISLDIRHTVTLDVAPYAAQITISQSGSILPLGLRADGIFATAANVGVLNDGTIAGGGSSSARFGGGDGISFATPNGTVINVGVIVGGGDGGAGVDFGGTLNNSGLIVGGAGGKALPGGTGVIMSDGTATNSGTIMGGAGTSATDGFGGNGVELDAFTTFFNQGTILGGTGTSAEAGVLISDGVVLVGGSLINTGTIAGGADNGTGVTFVNGGLLINAAVVSGAPGGIGVSIVSNTLIGTLVNSGTISGGGGSSTATAGIGVYMFGGTLINTGLISVAVNNVPDSTYGGSGVELLGGTVVNGGTFEGGAAAAVRDGYGGAGLKLVFGTVTNNAAILGGAEGGTGVELAESPLSGNGTALLDNAGLIAGGIGDLYQAAGVGVGIGYSGLLDNVGTIRGGTGVSGGADYAVYGGNGINMTSGFAANSGLISAGAGLDGGDGGDGALLFGGTLANSGTVLGGGVSAATRSFGGAGVDLIDGSVANSGRIAGAASGASYRGGFGADLRGGTLTNAGVITAGAGGSLGGAGGVGVYLDGGTLINAGTISGGVGSGAEYAVSSGSAASTVIIDPGAVFNGRVVGSGVNDTLELGSAASAGTISGLGTQFAGFSTTEISPGADWVLLGANTISGQALIGGTLAVAGGSLDLAGVTGGAGDITIGTGATLVLNQLTAVDITFAAGGAEELEDDTSISPDYYLIGFGAGDTIDLEHSRVHSVSFANGTLTLDNPLGKTIGEILFMGSYDTANFTLRGDGQGGTDIGFTSVPAALASGLADMLARSSAASETTASPTLAHGAVLWPDVTPHPAPAAFPLGSPGGAA